MFSDVAVKKQIGNAVPPIVARVVLEEVRRGLIRADGVGGKGGLGGVRGRGVRGGLDEMK